MTATGYPAPCIDLPGGAANSTGAIASATAGQVMGWRSYTLNSATSGNSYGGRFQHYITGAAGGGAALRAYGLVKGVSAATLYGAEISAEIMSTASSAVSGLCAAVKADIICNLSASGTCAVADLSYTVASGKTAAGGPAFIRVGSTGSGTAANVFLNIADTAGSQSATALVSTVKTAATNWSHGIRCTLADGTPLWIMATTTTPAA